MANKHCIIPEKGIDDKLSELLGLGDTFGTNSSYLAAIMRGTYERVTGKPLNVSDLGKAAKEMEAFRKEQKKARKSLSVSTGTNSRRAYKNLRRVYTPQQRADRVRYISEMFSLTVSNAQKSSGYSREAILGGVKYIKNGKYYNKYGEFLLFETVYKHMQRKYAEYMASSADSKYNEKTRNLWKERAEKYLDIIENWSSLVTLARVQLRDTEGIKLGNKISYVEATNESNFNDNDLEILHNLEESTREHWQEANDQRSAFGTLSTQVRRALGEIPALVKIGDNRFTYDYDDLGEKRKLNPVKAHARLMEQLRGMTTEAEMMMALKAQTWSLPIYDMLEKDPVLKTMFFVDFKKNFQPYSIMTEKVDKQNSNKSYKTKVINRTENLMWGSFLLRAKKGLQLDPNVSIYDSKGIVSKDKILSLFEYIQEWTVDKKDRTSSIGEKKDVSIFDALAKYGDSEDNPRYYTKGVTVSQKVEFFHNVFKALGIEVDNATVERIVRDRKGSDARTIYNNLKELSIYGQKHVGRIADGKKTYSYLLNLRKNDEEEGVFAQKIRKIQEVLSKNADGLRMQSKCKYKDAKGNTIILDSNVNPSYLGDKIDKIKSFVNVNDKAGLKEYIEQEFLRSPYFCLTYSDGKKVILNKWLEELYESCNSRDNLIDTFAGSFSYERFLGTSDLNFENFTGKRHMLSMLLKYRADREISPKSEYAMYPVFILGDSGVSKYIRAKRYSEEEILNGFYNIYRQEIKRIQLVKESNALLFKGNPEKGVEHYSKIKNISGTFNRFTMLDFLNKDFNGGKYYKMLADSNGKVSEKTVKAAVKAYLMDACGLSDTPLKDNFKSDLAKLGLLKSSPMEYYGEKTHKYEYLGSKVHDDNLNDTIYDFYINSTFAMIQQLQMMTIDVGYYKDVKDLQKRYKEIHSPGTVLSIDAVDSNGKKYSKDGIETCVYFDDIEMPAHEDFMKAIDKNNPSVYNKYLKNSLTDGQGYRSLDSYRKVMGMAGRWTDEMQKVYEAIKDLKAAYGDDVPIEAQQRIIDMAVIFQPIKPYMFTHEELQLGDPNKDIMFIPVQHKYAEVVLIPELLPKGSKLKDMAEWMEENNVDMVGSTTVVKVGSFGSTDISKANNRNSLRAALDKGYKHKLRYQDYRIQGNVPVHAGGQQLFGTQIRKLIMAGINMKDAHYSSYVGGKQVNLGGKTGNVTLDGRNLVAFYNSLIMANILESFHKFADAVSTPEKVSDILTQSTITHSRESMDNLLAYSMTDEDTFTLELFEGGLEHDSAAALWGLYRKMVNKQTMAGGSAVQASAMGIRGYNEDDNLKFVTDDNGNILYAECEMPFSLSFVDHNGKEFKPAYEDYCNEDGTLKIYKDENGNIEYDEFGEPLSELESEFPGILNIVAYRIPTERDYSMINMRVKRFSNPVAGGTIKVPVQGTTISGFDFDR